MGERGVTEHGGMGFIVHESRKAKVLKICPTRWAGGLSGGTGVCVCGTRCFCAAVSRGGVIIAVNIIRASKDDQVIGTLVLMLVTRYKLRGFGTFCWNAL